MGIGNFGFRSFNAVVLVGPELEVRREGFEVFKSGVEELEGGRRFGECSSKKTIGSRNPVLLAPVPGSMLSGIGFSPIGIAISPVLPPVGNHRNRSSEFVESQQKSPYANGGVSLDSNRTIANNRYLWSMGVRITTATLVKAGRFRTPELSSVYSKQTE